MFPVLFSIGPFSLNTFPLVILLSLICAAAVVWRRAREDDLEFDDVLDISIVFLISGLLGGRFLEIIFSLNRFLGESFAFFTFWSHPGFSIWGVLSGGFLGAYFILRRKRLGVFRFFDYLACGLSFAIPIIFLGYILSGIYYGAETSWFWGVSTPQAFGKRQPVALFGLILTICLLVLILRLSRRSHAPGFFFFLWISGFSLSSFFLEFLRGDSFSPERKIANLVTSLIFFIGSTMLFYIRLHRSPREDFGRVFEKSTVFLESLGKISREFLTKIKRLPKI